MKATFKTEANGNVTISYDSKFSGERITSEFFCPIDGGYVKEINADDSTSQVCEGLSSSGVTLICNSRDDLIKIIKKEYKAMQRNDAKHGF